MTPKKGHLGFDTTATALQEKYTNAVQAIIGVKGDWTTAAKNAVELGEIATKAYEASASATPKDVEWSRFWSSQRAIVLVLNEIAKVGMDIADLHKRVADCEKKIDEVKAAL
jgi:hypothetical protein